MGDKPFTTGQNAARFSGHQSDITYLMEKSVDMWYREVDHFKAGGPNAMMAVGHFTQVRGLDILSSSISMSEYACFKM